MNVPMFISSLRNDPIRVGSSSSSRPPRRGETSSSGKSKTSLTHPVDSLHFFIMGNGWVTAEGDIPCTDVCMYGANNNDGVALVERMNLVNSPQALDWVLKYNGEPNYCGYYQAVDGLDAPTFTGDLNGNCTYQIGEADPDTYVPGGENRICCCMDPEVNEGQTPEEVCPLPSDCELFGKNENSCDVYTATCVWLGGWRTQRRNRIKLTRQRLKNASSTRRKNILRRRIKQIYRQYVGCSRNAGCQLESRCANYCRPVCEQANCRWVAGEGCLNALTDAPTPGPTNTDS